MHAKLVLSPHLEWDRRHICANRVLSQRADVSSIVPQRTRMNQPVTVDGEEKEVESQFTEHKAVDGFSFFFFESMKVTHSDLSFQQFQDKQFILQDD